MNNNTEVAVYGVSDDTTSKTGDAVAGLAKVMAVVLGMAIAGFLAFVLCAVFEMSMGKTLFLCVVAPIFGGLFVAETVNGGKH